MKSGLAGGGPRGGTPPLLLMVVSRYNISLGRGHLLPLRVGVILILIPTRTLTGTKNNMPIPGENPTLHHITCDGRACVMDIRAVGQPQENILPAPGASIEITVPVDSALFPEPAPTQFSGALPPPPPPRYNTSPTSPGPDSDSGPPVPESLQHPNSDVFDTSNPGRDSPASPGRASEGWGL